MLQPVDNLYVTVDAYQIKVEDRISLSANLTSAPVRNYLQANGFAGVGGVVHTHSTAATAWAQARRPIPPFGTTHADHFRGAVPVTRGLTEAEVAGDYEAVTGSVIVEALQAGGFDPLQMPAVLVASHGPFAWG